MVIYMNLWRRLSLRTQILIFFVATTLITIVLTGIAMFYSIGSIFEIEEVNKVVMENDVILMLWIVGSILLVVTISAGTYFANNITTPLKKLEKSMDSLENYKNNIGDFQNLDGNLEIESLSSHFIDMTKNINRLMNENSEKEKALRISELKTLHSQINPHFIYNTIDTIVWLAEFGNNEKVVDVSKAMAKFFRLSLRGGSEFTTVRDELEHVRQYLYIQKERYQEKLDYEINFEEEILDVNIPKIILQPLVENSIYHGIRRKKGNGRIVINANKDGDKLILSVSDNGNGFDSSVLVKRSEELRLGGVGLNNIDERIKLYYGDGFGIKIDNSLNEGAKVEIILGNFIYQKF